MMESATASQRDASSQAADPPVRRSNLLPLATTFAALLCAAAVGNLRSKWTFPLPANVPAQDIPVTSVPAPSRYANAYNVTHIISSDNTQLLYHGVIHASEHIDVDADGMMWLASKNGTVYTARAACSDCAEFGSLREEVFVGPGRPLGFARDGADGLYVCNSLQGLMYWKSGSKHVTLVSNRVSPSSPLHPGRPFYLPNAVAVAPDGKVYFTTSSDIPPIMTRDGSYDIMESVWLTLLSGSMRGMLLVYDPDSGETTCLLDDMWFPNGIAVSQDGDYLLWAETNHLLVAKYYLKGPKAEQIEVVLKNLPAFPDNINRNADGTFWVALVGVVDPLVTQGWLFRSKLVRTLLAFLPPWARPPLVLNGGGIHFDGDGNVLAVVRDISQEVATGTSSGLLLPHGSLLMANLAHDFVSLTNMEAAQI